MNKSLYRGYDQEALDAQYFLRPLVPDFQEYFDKYARASTDARASLGGEIDISYGPSEAEKLDVFALPDGSTDGGGAPVHVFIHGGYWQSMKKSDFDYAAAGLTPRGAVAVIVEYALAPSAGMDEIVRQNRAALAWVWRNAALFGGDPDRIHVSGHSAGGHLTAMMAATDWPEFADDLPADLVKSGLAISGLFDLEPIQLSYLNEILGMDPETAMRNSPQNLALGGGASMALTVGALETDEFRRQTADYGKYLGQLGAVVEVSYPEGLHHFSIADELGRPDSDLINLACRLMGLA